MIPEWRDDKTHGRLLWNVRPFTRADFDSNLVSISRKDRARSQSQSILCKTNATIIDQWLATSFFVDERERLTNDAASFCLIGIQASHLNGLQISRPFLVRMQREIVERRTMNSTSNHRATASMCSNWFSTYLHSRFTAVSMKKEKQKWWRWWTLLRPSREERITQTFSFHSLTACAHVTLTSQ